jgi:probable F420-dependent oxidoreductase
MKFGVGLPNYGKNVSFDAIRRVARAAEELGYDSVWTTDHIIVPQEDIEPYGRIFDALTILALVAPITARVRLGTSILVLPQRNPVLAAKQIATIDAASGGRMIVGVGVGWNEKEYANLSANFRNRGKRLDEDITLLRALWSNEQVRFDGRYTRIDDGLFAPLPAQKGDIPIWIGGNNEPSFARAAKLGDGWHPTGAPPEVIANGIKRINELKPARRLTISARLSINMDPNVSPTYAYRGAPRRRLSGTDDQIRATLREYAQAGLEYAALFFPMDDVAVTLAQMQRFARDLAPEFM